MTNTNMSNHTTVVRTSRGLSIAGTRITLYSILDYVHRKGSPFVLVRQRHGAGTRRYGAGGEAPGYHAVLIPRLSLTLAFWCAIMILEHLFGRLHNGAGFGWIPLRTVRRAGASLRSKGAQGVHTSGGKVGRDRPGLQPAFGPSAAGGLVSGNAPASSSQSCPLLNRVSSWVLCRKSEAQAPRFTGE